ncbi:hypothetical protein ALC56_08671 [Trachymyrmex septentrionalis]|uniref:Uncharacterized protein n=1 Tax=Trachymyrmex septentrionalis TaxID=34720 RepID=A0A195F8D4_9HYME|nr:hypothetical protein ALC56_08671 [Trachymyrmex septentrionalis]
MIKLNNICIQYTAWCRRDTATSLTHTPWSTRLGPARSQHRKSDETVHRIPVVRLTEIINTKNPYSRDPSTRLRDRSIEYRRDGSDFDVSHTFQRAIDPPGEPLSSSIGRFWRRRMAGR